MLEPSVVTAQALKNRVSRLQRSFVEIDKNERAAKQLVRDFWTKVNSHFQDLNSTYSRVSRMQFTPH